MCNVRPDDRRDLGLRSGLPPFLLGFLSACFQLYLLREFSARFFGNELTFGLFLGAWLLWGGIGSLFRPGARIPSRGPAGTYAVAILLFFAALVALRFSHRALGALPGEMIGLTPALAFAVGLALLVSFPLGRSFVLNSALLGGDVPRVYFLESVGAVAAGLLIHFLLVPHVSNWVGGAMVAAGASLSIFAGMEPSKTGRWAVLGTLLAAAAAVVWLDMPAQRAAWKPLRLIEAADTRYAKLQVLGTAEQISLLANGLPILTSPDPAGAEEAVHFALLQRPGPRRILLIGGGAGGGVAEALKYEGVLVDYVELDPRVIRMAVAHLDPRELASLRSPRTQIIFEDGRAYLRKTLEHYDAVLLDLPEPATAQINRFYTREFFAEVKDKLRPGGILGFRVPSAENYIGPDLARFLAGLWATLRTAFPEVAMVPGSNCVFLASDRPLSLDPEALTAAAGEAGIETRFFTREMLAARLHPTRVATLDRSIGEAPIRINRDLVPVSYYFHSILWAAQFRGLEANILRFFARIPSAWVLDLPLIVLALALILLRTFGRSSRHRVLLPVAAMGFTTILAEMALLIAFQAFFGYVYGKVTLLLTTFMAGLVAGSWLGRKKTLASYSDLTAVQGGFVILLAVTRAGLVRTAPEVLPYLFLLAFGALGGFLFVVANRLLRGATAHLGLGYGFDLLGSFLGIIAASTLVIPLWGIPALLSRLTVLNLLLFVFLSTASLRKPRNP